jgi:hypothetical protein
MHTDRHGLKHYKLTEKIIKIFFEVYNELGYGFLESFTKSRFPLRWPTLALELRVKHRSPYGFGVTKSETSVRIVWSKIL